MKTFYVFIGYDNSEHEAFCVARDSIIKNSTVPVKVIKLEHMGLRKAGLFKRRWEVDENGQYWCKEDGLPFSTGFSHSRFLVPELWRNIQDPAKEDIALFVDCDWLFTGDIRELTQSIRDHKLMNDNKSPVYCVQHNYKPEDTVKMHGIIQSPYNMKLWSSFMVFNMNHPDTLNLTAEKVNTMPGSWLHQFEWVENKHAIGRIDEAWNFIPGHSEKNTDVIKGIHFTHKGPWHPGGETVKYADLWFDAYNEYLKGKLTNLNFDTRGIINGD